MFGKNVFDETAKAAKKFDDIISRSAGMKTLASLSSSFSKNMKGADQQADRLLNRIRQLTQATHEQALASAGLTKQQYKRVTFYRDELDVVNELEEKLKEQLAIQEQISKTAQNRRTRRSADKKITDIKDQLNALPARRQGIMDMKEIDKQLAKSGQLTRAIDSAFGGLATKISNVVKALTGVLAPFAILAGVLWFLKKGFDLLQDGLKEAISQGLDASQRMAQLGRATQVTSDALFKGALLDPIEVMKSMAVLQERFGRLNVATELVQKSAELSRQINLSAEDAGNLLEFFIRIRRESSEAAVASSTILHATALSNNANPRKVMQDVANNAANFAKSSRASAENMAQAAIAVNKLGTNLTTVANIADNIVSNFESTLEAQASIGAFAPGFDMTSLLIASQFGTDKDIAAELKTAVDSLGVEFDSMPRSMKLAISSGLGLSVDELAKIASGEGSTLSPDGKAMQEANNMLLNEVQQGVANPLASINRGVNGIWSLLSNKFGMGTSDRVKAMTAAELDSAAMAGGGLGRAAIREKEARSIENQIQSLQKLNKRTDLTPVSREHIDNQLQTAYESLYAINPHAEILQDMKKQQNEFLRTFVEKMTGSKVNTTTVQLDGREIARATTRAAERGLGIPDRY